MISILTKNHKYYLFESLNLNLNQNFCQIIWKWIISEQFQHLIHVKKNQKFLKLFWIYMIWFNNWNKIILIFAIIMTETVNLIQQLDVFYYYSQMFINEQIIIISCLCQENLIILIEITILSNNIDIANVNTVIHWLDVYLLSNLIQQSRHAYYQKKKIYLILLLNSESQNVILSDKSDNNKMFKFYVNNS